MPTMPSESSGAPDAGRSPAGGDRGVDTDSSVFDRHLAAWRHWQQEPWGRLRYSVVWHVLQRHLPSMGASLRILDVGGGDGVESLRLAELGHNVVLVDFSRGMLAIAEEEAHARGIERRLTTIEAKIEELGAAGTMDLEPFDAALCHFVVQYVADPVAALTAISRLVAPGGLVSVIAPNPPSEVLAKAVRDGDYSAARALLDATTTYAATFDHEVRRILPDEGEGWLAAAGFDLVHRYGGRMVMDLVSDEAMKYDATAYSEIESLEHALCGLSPYRDIGRFWQLIGRRRQA